LGAEGSQRWGSGQGSASGAPPRVYQLKEKPIVTDLGGTSGGAHLGGTSYQGVFILVAHLDSGCSSWWYIWSGGVHQQQDRGIHPEGKGKDVVDVAQQVNQEMVHQDEVGFKAQTQGNIEVDAQKGEDSVKDKEETSKITQPKVHEPPLCHRCKYVSHIASECRRGWRQNKLEQVNHGVGNRKALSDLITPLCATQTDGHALFVIPRCPLEVNARERINIVVVTILKGDATTKLIEDEFTRILMFGDGLLESWLMISTL
jgi:hypothetical protein